MRRQRLARWVLRAAVIDREGRVAYKSAAGPFGFEPEQMERQLVETLKR
jgi:hypothetical protein